MPENTQKHSCQPAIMTFVDYCPKDPSVIVNICPARSAGGARAFWVLNPTCKPPPGPLDLPTSTLIRGKIRETAY